MRKKPPSLEDNVLFYSTTYSTEDTGKEYTVIKIIDDKNIQQSSLGLRRLHIPKEDLFPLNKGLYFLSDLIKYSYKKVYYIDSVGNTFRYKKSTCAKLRCFKLKKILRTGVCGSLLEIEGLHCRFKTLFDIQPNSQYVGILELNNKQYILYGLYDEPFKETYRKV